MATVSEHKILCCMCGTLIEPNATNMCVACLRSRVDITEEIPHEASVNFCKSCERYLQPPGQWMKCALESKELLALCLRKLKGPLTGLRLVDASFIWTEPHSRRLKVKLSVQKEALSAIIEQNVTVEFVVHCQMCQDCHRVEARDYWKAVVQVRQKVVHKKTFFYLEQLILKHNAHSNTLRINRESDGLDFFFGSRQDGNKFFDFLHTVVPCRSKTSQRLISQDLSSNTANYKHTISVELVPICKDGVVCLPDRVAASMGNIGQLLVCIRVANSLHFIDPTSLQISEMTASSYWRQPFAPLFNHKQLKQFMVMDMELVSEHERIHKKGSGCISTKHRLATAWVERVADMGKNEQLFARTHLGGIIHIGDVVLGYDFTTANPNDCNLDKLDVTKIPDVILVKKFYGSRAERHRRRRWKLKKLRSAETASTTDDEFIEFMEDLEEDPELRKGVNIYEDHRKVAFDVDDEGAPTIGLEEMLSDLKLDGDGGDMK